MAKKDRSPRVSSKRDPFALGGPDWETVRVFVSSTFKDMEAEREVLAAQVFPVVREWCLARRLLLREVDLRWGIPDNAAASGALVDKCLSSVDQCSVFIALIGSRYGFIPPLESISKATLLQRPGLRELLAGGVSLTELEIRQACPALWSNDAGAGESSNRTALFYLRDPAWLDELSPDERALAARHMDAATIEPVLDAPDGRWPQAHRARGIAALRQRIQQGMIPDSVRQYQATCRAERGGPRFGNLRCGTGSFGLRVADDLIAALAQAFTAHDHRVGERSLSAVDPDWARHASFALESAQRFVGRTPELESVDRDLEKRGVVPILITGGAGVGKSAFLGRWAHGHALAHPSDVVVTRFAGVGDKADDASRTLLSVIEDLGARHRAASLPAATAKIPTRPEELRDSWVRIVSELLPDRRKIVVIDGIDNLENDADALDWVPARLPQGVALLMGVTDLDRFERFLLPGEFSVQRLDSLQTPDERAQLVQLYLEDFFKELNAHQLDRLISSPPTANPLLLRAVLSELRFATHDDLDQMLSRLPEHPRSAFDVVLERLEQRIAAVFDLPAQVVPLILTPLALSRRGLSVQEITAIVGSAIGADVAPLTDVVGSVVAQLMEFLVRRSDRFAIRHDAFHGAIAARYLSPTPASLGRTVETWHAMLADLFAAQPNWLKGGPNRRKVDVLPWHLARAGAFERLESALADHDFLEAKVAARQTDDLLSDFAALSAKPEPPRSKPDLRGWLRRRFGRSPTEPSASCDARGGAQAVAELSAAVDACAPLFRTTHGGRGTVAQTIRNGAAGGPACTLAERYLHDEGLPCFLLEGPARPQGTWSYRRPRMLYEAKEPTADGDRESDAFDSRSVWAARMSEDGYWALTEGSNQICAWNLQTGRRERTLETGPWSERDGLRLRGELGPIALSPGGSVAARGTVLWHLPHGRRRELDRERLKGHVIAFSRDGGTVAVRRFNTLLLYDLANEREVSEVAIGYTVLLSVSVNGRVAVAVGPSQTTFEIWDLERRVLRREIQTRGFVDEGGGVLGLSAIATDAMGEYLLTGSMVGEIALWDIRSGRRLKQLRRPTSEGGVSFVALGNGGQHAVTSNRAGTELWDARRGRVIRALPEFHCVAASVDAGLGLGGPSNRLELVDLRGHRAPRQPFEHATGIACSDDGQVIAVTLAKPVRSLQVWSSRSPAPQWQVSLETDPIAVATTPDGRFIAIARAASGDATALDLYDVERRARLSSADVEAYVRHVAVLPGGQTVLTSGQLGAFLRSPSGKLQRQVRLSTRGSHSSRNGQYVCVYEKEAFEVQSLLHPEDRPPIEEDRSIGTMCVGDGGQIALTGCEDGSIGVWNVAQRALRHRLRGHDQYISSLALSHDDAYAVSAGWDGVLRVWELERGTCPLTIPCGASASEIALGRDGLLVFRTDRTAGWGRIHLGHPSSSSSADICHSALSRVGVSSTTDFQTVQ